LLVRIAHLVQLGDVAYIGIVGIDGRSLNSIDTGVYRVLRWIILEPIDAFPDPQPEMLASVFGEHTERLKNRLTGELHVGAMLRCGIAAMRRADRPAAGCIGHDVGDPVGGLTILVDIYFRDVNSICGIDAWPEPRPVRLNTVVCGHGLVGGSHKRDLA